MNLRLALFIAFALLAAPAFAATSYLVTQTTTVISESGICQEVSNTGAGTRYISTNTSAEWQSYVNNPNGLGMLSCCFSIWYAQDSNRSWRDIASSSDGTKLATVVANGQIYTSTDSGENWTARDSSRNWRNIASSSDGTKLVATVPNGQVYTSTNSGVNWTARATSRNWYGIASSSDGTKLAALVLNGQIYTSTDSGVNWTARDSSRVWADITSSADGTKLAATVNGGQI